MKQTVPNRKRIISRTPLTRRNQHTRCRSASNMLRARMVYAPPVTRRLLLRRFAAGTPVFGTFLLPPAAKALSLGGLILARRITGWLLGGQGVCRA